MPRVSAGAATQIATDVFALSSLVGLEEPLSWVAPAARGYDPSTCYLIRAEGEALLIDSGLHAHGQYLLEQLENLIPRELPLTIAFTRVEPDCLGNLLAVAERFNVVKLASQSNVIPFDYLGPYSSRFPEVEVVNGLHPGDRIPIGESRELLVIEPAVRTLPTLWFWEERAGALFTSDFFCEDRPLEASDWMPGHVTATSAREHLLAKFDWIALADTSPAVARLDRTFETHAVAVLAPGHGRWVVGRDAVHQRYLVVREALALSGKAKP